MEIFISYAHSEEGWAKHVADELRRRGITCFLDAKDLHSGDSYRERLRSEIASCEEVFAIVSAKTLERPWVMAELGAAWGHSKRISPLLLPGVSPAQVATWFGALHAKPISKLAEVIDGYLERRALQFQAIQGDYEYNVYDALGCDDTPKYRGRCAIRYDTTREQGCTGLRFDGERHEEAGARLARPRHWHSVWSVLFPDRKIRSEFQFRSEDVSRQSLASLAYDASSPKPMISGRVFRIEKAPEVLCICLIRLAAGDSARGGVENYA